MPLNRPHPLSRTDKTTTVAVSAAIGLGVGVAALAGGAALAGAAFGTGLMTLSASSHSTATTGARASGPRKRHAKPAVQEKDVRWDAEGRLCNWQEVLKIARQGGIVPELRAMLWPILVGVYGADWTALEREIELRRLRNLYTKLVLVCEELEAQVQVAKASAFGERPAIGNLPSGSSGASSSTRSSSLPGNLASFAESHRIIVMDAVRTDLRTQPLNSVSGKGDVNALSNAESGSMQTSSRKELSMPSIYAGLSLPTVSVLPVSVSDGIPELMLVDPPTLGPAEAVASGQLPLWRSDLAASTIDAATHVNPISRRLMLRMVNILSAYAVHDPESGYCQGMSDLAATFVQLMDDDALAFACFERLMRHARQNFRHDEMGIKRQLSRVARIISDTDPVLYKKLEALGVSDCMFAYRMVLVMLRRELPLEHALTLWEAKWSTETLTAFEEGQLEANKSTKGTLLARGSGSTPLDTSRSHDGNDHHPPTSSGGAHVSRMNSTSSRSTSHEFPASVLSPVRSSSSTSSLNSASAGAVGSRERTDGGGGGGDNTVGGSNGQKSNGGGGSGHGSSWKSLSKSEGYTGGPTSSGSLSKNQGHDPSFEPPDFILHFIVAVVRAERRRILSECRDSDDILRMFNSLKIDFWSALAHARKQYKAYVQGSAVLERL